MLHDESASVDQIIFYEPLDLSQFARREWLSLDTHTHFSALYYYSAQISEQLQANYVGGQTPILKRGL